MKRFYQKIKKHIFVRILFYYLISLSITSVFLMTPWSWKEGHVAEKSWNFINSFYIVSSAISTTGLTIYDLGEQMSVFGQVVILILIVIGGMGLLFFKFWIFRILSFLMRKKQNILWNREQYFERGYFRVQNTKEMILVGFFFMSIIQFLGAVVLFFYFFFIKIDKLDYYDNGLKSFWSALFHSVSATNNAGFDIFQDGVEYNSLQIFQKHYFIQIVFIFQFTLGGLGFPVFFEFYQKTTQKKEIFKKKINFFTKFVLVSYFSLAIFSIIIVLILESTISGSKFSNNPSGSNFMNIVFNTLSSRSAGYSTVVIDDYFTDASKYFLSFLMWIGCAPISTGGGIKVTTLAILILSIFCWTDSKRNLFIKKNKSISSLDVVFAYKVMFTSLFLLFAFCLIFLAQNSANNDNQTINAIFYATSALGNVGLTTLNTEDFIDGWYAFKITSIILMVIGQIGVAQIIWFTRNKEKEVTTEVKTFSQEMLF